MAEKFKKLMIIDGNALIHRSFHALPATMITTDGTVVNAVYGFASFLIKAMRDMKPEYVVLTLDRKGPTFRHEKFKEYKAKRVKAPDELYAQIPLVRQLAMDFNIPVFELDGFEADDLIGTITKQVESEKLKIESIIVTGDKDTMQLINGHTKVYSMSRGLLDSVLYDEKAVLEKMGVRVDQIVDFKALAGDPSDNIPGVPGIGAKTAVELLLEFGNLDKLYGYAKTCVPVKEENIQQDAKTSKKQLPPTGSAASDKIKPRILELLLQHKDSAYLSRELATIRKDAPIKFDLEATRFFDLDKDRIIKALTDLEFKSLLPRLQNLFNEVGLDTKAKKQTAAADKFERDKKDFKYVRIDTEEKFTKFLVELKKQKRFSFDTETTGLNVLGCGLLGISFAWKTGSAYFVQLEINNNNQEIQNAVQGSLFNPTKKPETGKQAWLEKLKPIFADSGLKKNAHNAKFDIRVLQNQGVAVKGLEFDTMLASYLLNPGTRGHGLDASVFTEFGFEKISKDDLLGTGKDKKDFSEVEMEKLSLYSCEDADFTQRLRDVLEPKLAQEKLDQLFRTMELPLVLVLADMENTGIKINADFLALMGKKMKKDIKALEKKIFALAGQEFNIRSTKQLKEILFERMGLPTGGIKKTKTGFSTGEEELEKLKEHSPVISFIQEHRELSKLTSTYIDALPELVNPLTGRVHTSYNQTVAATGRLSSSDPNLQNIPIRTELGNEIRKAFIAPAGCKLLALDYSQIELRLAAHLSGDKKMIKAFQTGADIHSATAAEVNQIALSEVTKEMRREAKATNFGVLYGQGAHGLAQTAGIPYARAKDFIDNYFAVYTGIKRYIDEKIAFAREHGYVETMFGRKRFLPEINSTIAMVKKGAERMAMNTPIQGTAADIIKLAMIEIAVKIQGRDDIRLLLQVHDELIFEVREDRIAKAGQMIKEIMESIAKLDVPLVADIKVGDSWGEMG